MFNYEVALNYWEVFLLILVRVASFIYTAPFFGISNVPQRTKLGLAVFMSAIIFTLVPDRTLVYAGTLDYAILIIKESAVGLLLGFSANIATFTLYFTGHIVDVNIGFSMATVMDPTTRQQTSVSGTLYYYAVYLILLISGMYQFICCAIVDSYTIIPIGKATINLTLYDSFLKVIANFFLVGFRIAMPVFVGIMIINVVLGVLTKVAPQLNMFAIGMQLKLLAGLGIMFLTIWLLPNVATYLMSVMEESLKSVAGGLV